ncbi:predicted protein [Chaetomium globosum CBS 148.51]|uniref:Uncharacterized protein n=1 Tax=Chaetomium globosum (strain ATCC 6205 / CBS 148.51 / DSM 1962 / NBRC 6347 / NRRL 1970) TaxID=306901 RepID=Q2H414_CHAGB|nr:uncharacterized protein CHGG_06601 [Chaetomium globosum CBS 148.51]EAQ89982.1 predicted protein [Chaetomium globosum CBS 148.51]
MCHFTQAHHLWRMQIQAAAFAMAISASGQNAGGCSVLIAGLPIGLEENWTGEAR